MKITNKDIDRDVSFVLGEIKSAEVEIPSFWRCIWPSLVFVPLFLVWQAYIFLSYKSFHDPSGIMVFSIFFSFVFTLISTQARGKYFSLPERVRKSSLIINLIKAKYRFYSLIWIFSFMAFCLMMRHFDINAEFNIPMFMLLSLIVVWFFLIADLSRYDLSLLNAAIQRWREGGDMPPPMSSQHHQQ